MELENPGNVPYGDCPSGTGRMVQTVYGGDGLQLEIVTVKSSYRIYSGASAGWCGQALLTQVPIRDKVRVKVERRRME
jgi:hypothetical protein